MNIANKLTLMRVVIIPFFIVFGLIGGTACGYIALALFVIASFTDYLDGHLARKLNLVSNFGKFLDPIADKLLVLAALALLVGRGEVSVWVFYIVVMRELVVSGVRLVAAAQGRVIQAAMTGKIKTVFQMIVIILALIPWVNDNILAKAVGSFTVLDILMYIMTLITLVSGAEYVVKNADVIKPE
ncbi:MAG: CDP-diacylglycerol--glycerol-3-phosphate 3-phosphatidyltransferase [Ruminococcaceae bacterium]|nr:CDP-diacylglycerol--glycerol-3-phosphate 3-phosphatidyltransferase [Oscillospiraceae bacterium]